MSSNSNLTSPSASPFDSPPISKLIPSSHSSHSDFSSDDSSNHNLPIHLDPVLYGLRRSKRNNILTSDASDNNSSQSAFSSISSESLPPRKKKKKIKNSYVRFSSRNKHVTNYDEEFDSPSDEQSFDDNVDDHETDLKVVSADLTESIPSIEIVLDHRTSALDSLEYLIKWSNSSHRKNTWHSYKDLANTKGIRKIDHYNKRLSFETEQRNSEFITKEEIEQMDIIREMQRGELSEYQKVDRVINERINENGLTEYLCKWKLLPYKECTWEHEETIQDCQDCIDEYLDRRQSATLPHKSASLRNRPPFHKFTTQPSYLKAGELRDYQLLGVNWLSYLWHQNKNGILADEMGLGKTIQSISFLSYLFNTIKIYGPYLVVVPLSTINAWQREFLKWAPEINTIVYIGDAKSRTIIRDNEFYSGNHLKFNALVTTYELILKDRDILGKIKWQMLCVDEAHRLKNSSSLIHEALKDFSTANRLLITGTPLQNNIKELVSLIQFLMPDKFKEFEFGDMDGIDSLAQDKIEMLQKKLQEYMLRRLKKDVEKSLPQKTERILRVELSAMQLEFYKNIYSRNFAALNKGLAAGGQNTLLNICMELKKAANHAYLFPNAEVMVEQKEEQLKGIISNSGKMALLDKLLARLKEGKHRVLVFSQMVRMLDIISDYLVLRGYLHQRLDGSTSAEMRKRAMDHFNAPESPDFVFLLSTRAGGLGINLETADTVIIFDSDWNPQNDLQAMARAHRIGQKKIVNVYRFVSKDTIEEDVLERAKRKMVLEYCIIKQMDTSGQTVLSRKEKSNANQMSKEELQIILKFGAQNLFKAHEQDSSNRLDDLNIDEILSRAEQHTTEEATGAVDGGAEFLEQWRVEDVAMTQLSWDEIIPESERPVGEIESAEYVGPRTLKTLSYAEKEKRGKPRVRHTGDENAPLSEKETRSFIKSVLRYGSISERGEEIVKDSDLDDRSFDIVTKAYNELYKICSVASASQTEKSKKMIPVSYNGVSQINSGLFVSRVTDLDVLSRRIKSLKTPLKFRLSGSAASIKMPSWSIKWSPSDDAMLLLGIYLHGYGNWGKIQADSTLPFGQKFFLRAGEADGDEEDDKSKTVEKDTRLPKAVHLCRRADLLLKMLREDDINRQEKASNSRRKSNSSALPVIKSETKLATVADLKSSPKPKLKEKPKEKLSKAEVMKSAFDSTDDDADDESDVSMDTLGLKEIMRPIKKDLSLLHKDNSTDKAEKASFLKTTLLKIGQHISVVLADSRTDSEVERTRLERNLWKFASKFWPVKIHVQQFRDIHDKIVKIKASNSSLNKMDSQESLNASSRFVDGNTGHVFSKSSSNQGNSSNHQKQEYGDNVRNQLNGRGSVVSNSSQQAYKRERSPSPSRNSTRPNVQSPNRDRIDFGAASDTQSFKRDRSVSPYSARRIKSPRDPRYPVDSRRRSISRERSRTRYRSRSRERYRSRSRSIGRRSGRDDRDRRDRRDSRGDMYERRRERDYYDRRDRRTEEDRYFRSR